MSAPTSQLPLFVPRVAAASERTATQLARRIMAPVRSVGVRALRFADRVAGGWLGATASVGGGAEERPAARVVRSPAGMVMPRPWYELEQEPAIALPVRRSVVEEPIETAVAQPAAAEERAPEPTVAQRGAAIPRTQIEAPPEVVRREERAAVERRRADPAPSEPAIATPPVVPSTPVVIERTQASTPATSEAPAASTATVAAPSITTITTRCACSAGAGAGSVRRAARRAAGGRCRVRGACRAAGADRRGCAARGGRSDGDPRVARGSRVARDGHSGRRCDGRCRRDEGGRGARAAHARGAGCGSSRSRRGAAPAVGVRARAATRGLGGRSAPHAGGSCRRCGG